MTDPSDLGATRGGGPSSAPRPATVTAERRAGESAEEVNTLVGRVLVERYRIEKLLGSGGMGSVYRAQHVHMRKSVAIKVLHREMTYLPEIVARFEREAVAAARIEHPNVAAATDFGRLDDGSFYLVLEYVEGRSLRELIKEHKRLQTGHALHITRQIAAALAAAHAAGIVHRDLKPDNVMLIRREGELELVKVLDFGIAKVSVGEVQEQPLTQLGTVFGTPEYMSPEQAQGLAVDARADLYTLGILLYEMLAGKTPFHDEDLIVVLTRQLTMDPPPLPGDVDARVSSLAIQLLQKTPDVRVQTAAEVVRQIEAILGSSLAPSPLSGGAYGPQSSAAPSSMAASSAYRRPIAKTEPMEATPEAGPPSAVVGAQTGVEFGETVLSLQRPELYGAPPSSMLVRRPAPWGGATLLDRVRVSLSDTLPKLRQKLAGLRRTVHIGGQPVPLWAIVAAGAIVLIVGLWLLIAGLSEDEPPVPMPGATTQPKPIATPSDPSLAALIEKAQTGDRASLSELLVRPESKRSAAEWRAIARGQSRLGQYATGLVSYRRALALAPGLASDAQLLRDVRDAAERPDAAQAALGLAASSLGAGGADLLWDVWDAHRKDPKNSALAKSARQYVDSVRAKASPALAIAIDLNNAKKCPEVKDLMPRALQYADERSVPRLKSLKSTSGCGFLGFADCFSCLRRDKSVSDALTTAQTRPAPRLGAAPLSEE